MLCRKWSCLWAAMFCALAVGACTPIEVSNSCTPGGEATCLCPGGTIGKQVCDESGSLGACQCGGDAGDVVQDVAPDVEPDVDVGADAEPETVTDADADAEPETVADADADSEAETVSDADAEPETVTDADAEPETVTDADAEPETVADADAEPETVTDADAEPETVADADAEPETVADADVEPETVADADADATGDAGPTVLYSQAADDALEALVAELDAALTLPLTGTWSIPGAWVTYVKPAIGGDPEGFFIQADVEGPALFVDYPEAEETLAAGDEVDVELDVLDIVDQMRRGTGVVSVTVLSSGHDVSVLAQDASDADLEADLGLWESRLTSISGTITSGYGFAGAGHSAVYLATVGSPGGDIVRARFPTTVADQVTVLEGCVMTITQTPMWRFNAVPQPSAWDVSEITVSDCPPLVAVEAQSIAPDSVRVTFDQELDPASVILDGSQFTVVEGLGVTGASVSQAAVFLTTATQTPNAAYTLVVSSNLQASSGQPMDAAATLAFVGYDPATAPLLVINEFDYDNPGADSYEFVEIYNPSSNPASLAGLVLEAVNGSNGLPYGTTNLDAGGVDMLPAGGYLVVGTAGTVDVGLPPGTPFIPLVVGLQNGGIDGDGLRIVDAGGLILDGVAYEGPVAGATVMEGSGPAPTDLGDESISRCPNGSDSDDNAFDFAITLTSTAGAPNACP